MPTSVLAGRRRELAALRTQFKAAAAGRAGVALVVGDPGIGKTRLLEEAARCVEREGALVLRGGTSDGTGSPPYLPFLEALGAYIQGAPLDDLRDQTGEAAPTLASIFPELTARLGELPAGHPLPPEQARFRLYGAVGSFIAAIAQSRPLVLILDDLHSADAASLDLLCYIQRRHPKDRLLVLGAYREGETGSNSALARAVDNLNRHRALATVMLCPLSQEEIASLAAGYFETPVAHAVSRLLYAHSEGNPFFAEELLRDWLEGGGVVQQEEHWILAPAFDAGRIPPGIVGAIQLRVGRLPPDVTGLLRTAAVIGRTFDPRLLAAVENLPVDFVEERLATAHQTGLLRADRPGTWTFSHDKIRECLYTQVTPARRQHLHKSIGLALEARNDRDDAGRLSVLAFHFVRGDDRERGIAYSTRAAETALGAYAAEDAAAHYRTALDLLAPNDGRRGQILLGLGKAALLANSAAEAARTYESAQTWEIQRGDVIAAARAAMGLGEARSRLGSWDGGFAAWEAAVTLLADHPGPQAVQALAGLASQESYVGRCTDGIRHAERALQLARTLRDPRLESRALQSLGKLLTRLNKIEPSIRALEQALERARAIDDPAEIATCYYRLAYVTRFTAQLRRSREMSLACLDFARRAHDPYQVLFIQAWLAMASVIEGNWPQAEQLIAQVWPGVEHMIDTEPHEVLLRARGLLAYRRGDYPAAEREYRALETSLKRNPGAVGRYRGLLGLAQLAVGKRHEAQAYVAEQEALLAVLEEGSMPTAQILAALAAMALQIGDRDRTLRYYPRLLSFQGQWHLALIDRVLAEIEILQGDWPAAEAHLAAAETVAAREGYRPEQPLIVATRANLELARGGPGSALRARDRLGEALRGFQELGMAAEASRARKRLRDLPRQPGGRDHPLYPAGLSAREVQILRLVASGHSNRQIAGELALSEKTVATHLTAIFNKTATDNRAGATAFALRNGLA